MLYHFINYSVPEDRQKRGNMKPTIGIIGGCGPLATVDIEYKILQATQRLLSPLVDQDYFNMLVFNFTQFSDRNDAITQKDQDLSQQFLKCAQLIQSVGVNLLLIACQTAHVYLPKIKAKIKLPFLDIVEETVSYLMKNFPNISKVGLLSTEATQQKRLYQNILSPYEVEVVSVPQDIQKTVMEAIYIIKTGINLTKNDKLLNNAQYGCNNAIKYPNIKSHPYRQILLEKTIPNPVVTIQKAIQNLASQGCQHVILGCTELPLLLPFLDNEQFDVHLIDPNTIISESTVAFAHMLEAKSSNNFSFLTNDEKMNNSIEIPIANET